HGHAATYCSDPHLISSHAFSKNRAQPAIALKSDTSALLRFYTASADTGRSGKEQAAARNGKGWLFVDWEV
ncbi:MAG: hypothetical protein ACSLE1_19530, partial [Sphingobium sp.]